MQFISRFVVLHFLFTRKA